MPRVLQQSRGTGPRATEKNAFLYDRGGQAPALRVSRPLPLIQRSRGTGPRATGKKTALVNVGRGPSDALRASERVSLATVHAPDPLLPSVGQERLLLTRSGAGAPELRSRWGAITNYRGGPDALSFSKYYIRFGENNQQKKGTSAGMRRDANTDIGSCLSGYRRARACPSPAFAYSNDRGGQALALRMPRY